jgi:hypothetical protein
MRQLISQTLPKKKLSNFKLKKGKEVPLIHLIMVKGIILMAVVDLVQKEVTVEVVLIQEEAPLGLEVD